MKLRKRLSRKLTKTLPVLALTNASEKVTIERMIRKLNQNDRSLYLRLTREFYDSDAVLAPVPEEYRVATFEELLRSDAYAQCYFLCDGENPVGYALLAKTFSQEAGGVVLWLEEIFLRPESRGKGLGKEFFAFLDTLGAARLRLEAEPDNARAIALYRSLGYSELPYLQMVKASPKK